MRAIFDVGADDGIHGILFAFMNPKIKVFAFEPIKGSKKKIEKNLKKVNFFFNTKIINYEIINSAVSDFNGYSIFYQTYYKVVDDNSALNTDSTRNKITTSHVEGTVYTDIVVNCLLDYGEPSGQSAFDNTNNFDGTYVFDELGLKSWVGTVNTGKLLTHVVFHPVQKSLNRLIEIEYTVRIQNLTNLSSVS